MDLMLGSFADAALASFDNEDLDAFETLIEVPDRDLFGWLVDGAAVPANYDTRVLRRLQIFLAEGLSLR